MIYLYVLQQALVWIIAKKFSSTILSASNTQNASYCAFSAIFFLKNHCKDNLGLSPLINGTGFMVKFDVVKPNGWETETLTEDIEFSLRRMHHIVRFLLFSFLKTIVKHDLWFFLPLVIFSHIQKLCQGEEVVQGYRDIKNPTDSWVSAGYAIFYWMMNRFYHLARYLLLLMLIVLYKFPYIVYVQLSI